jgi:N-acetylglutamate synthase-like GNAT family acetyltransferase
MEFEFIADRVEAIPVVARWLFEEWGRLDAGSSCEKTCATISESCNRDRAPLMILAIEGNSVVGCAALKPHEMVSIFPNYEPWLGSVYVHPEHRNRGLGSQLTMKVVDIATSIGVKQLFLQTVRLDGGLYARLGWTPMEQVRYRGEDVLVMEKKARPKPATCGQQRRGAESGRRVAHLGNPLAEFGKQKPSRPLPGRSDR